MTTTVQVFDEVAGVYDEVLPFFAELGRQIVDVVDPGPGTRLLDLGSGRGAATGPALARGTQVTAVDAAPAMVVHLAADHPEASVLLMDVHHLDFPPAVFDVVAFADDLPADRRAAFRDRMLAQLSSQKVITLHRAAPSGRPDAHSDALRPPVPPDTLRASYIEAAW